MPELYTVRRRIGGRYIEEVVMANSRADANDMAERMGGEVTGTLFDEGGIEHEAVTDEDYDY